MITRFSLTAVSVMSAACVLLAMTVTANADVVYYVGTTPADTNLANHIQNDLGHTLVQVSSSAGSYGGALAADADLIVLSGSMSSSLGTGKGYHISQIPILNFEAFSYDNFGWTGDVQNTDFGDSATMQDAIQIDNTSHAITNGFSSGPATVLVDTAEDSRFAFGVPHADAEILASYQGPGIGSGAATIFVYEPGDQLAGPTDDNPTITTARSRYIGFFLDYGVGVPDLYGKMNASGAQLFDQVVDYALAYQPPAPQLIGHWTFDNADQFNDVSGDNHGTAAGGAIVTTETSAVGGGSLKLDNTATQYVTIDGLADEGLSTYDNVTLTMWVNTQRKGSAEGGDMADMSDNIAFSVHTADHGNLVRMGTGEQGGVYLNPTDIGGVAPNEENGSGLNDGQWHFLAITLDGGGTSTVWTEDGAGGLVEIEGFTNRLGQPKWTDAAAFTIGQEWDGGGATNPFGGYIDDVMFFSGKLSMAELLDAYERAEIEFSLLPGDANNDGKVDDTDATTLADNWLTGPGATWTMGDFNKDGYVNDIDATILAANWQAAAASASVPEPSTLTALLAIMLAGSLIGRRRR